MTDEIYMARALALAERGRGRTSPNPMVGALVVDDEGVVVGRGNHEIAGGAHAEIHALAEAGARARGATLYCTLEPCCHTGKTGPCVPRVADAGIRRVVAAMEDPNPLVSGGGFAHLRGRGVDVTAGVLRDAAERLNRPFFTRVRYGRPFVTLKVALSLDGRVAAAPGARTRLTGPAADRMVHRERAEIDAIAIGSDTVIADDPLLTPRGAYRHRPLTRVVFDRRLRTPPAARLVSTTAAGPVIIVTRSAALQGLPDRAAALCDRGVCVHAVDGDPASSDTFLSEALRWLATAGVTSLTVEGGPVLHEAFWTAGLVDRLQLFVTPHVLGPLGTPWMPLPDGTIGSLDERTAVPIGEDVLIEGYVHRTD